MKAIIAIGGNQYQIQSGEELKIESITGEVGKTIEAPVLLYWEKNQVLVGPEAKNIRAHLKVTKIEKGTKIHIRRYKSKVRHRRHIGFRPFVVSVIVDKITGVKKAAV